MNEIITEYGGELGVGHGLEDQPLSQPVDPRGGRQDGGDQLATHTENNDRPRVIDIQTVKTVCTNRFDCLRQPFGFDVLLSALHRSSVDIRGNGGQPLAVFRRDRRKDAFLTKIDGKIGVVGAYIGK